MSATKPDHTDVPLTEPSTSDTSASRGRGFLARFARKPLPVISLCYLVLIVGATVGARWIAPYGPEDQDLLQPLAGPSPEHLLGTGVLGKDILSRVLYGGQVTLLSVLIAVVVYAAIGIPAGIVAGYRGGWFDRLILRCADLVFAIPVVIILLVVLAIFPANENVAMVALGLLGSPGLARVVRSATLGVRQELYVRAAVAGGLRDTVILRRHVLPMVAGPILVQLSVYGAGAVLMETGLGFLGLGVTTASWGNLVAEASQNLGTQPWLLAPSGAVIIAFVLALGLLGDGVRDALAERRTPGTATATRPASAPSTSRPRASAPSDALLSVQDLTITLPVDGKRTDVVRDVSFTLGRGEALGIVGESGCGKTVTATSLLGLLPPGGEIAAGSVWFDGTDLVGATAERLRGIRGGRIGWIAQDPIAGLDRSFTAGAQVAEAVRAHTRCTRKQARQRVLDLFEVVRLPDPRRVARSYPHQLSGGMAQRVGIAGALAGDPALIVADEPTTALDVTVQADILDLLRGLQRDGTAIILVTHDWGVVVDLCQRAAVMYAGQLVEQAEVSTLINEPAHPYTEGLLKSDPHYGVPGRPLPALEGSVPAPHQWPVGCHFQNRCPLVTEACRAMPIPLADLDSGTHVSRCLRSTELVPTGGKAAAHD